MAFWCGGELEAAALSRQGHYTVDLLEELDEGAIHQRMDFEFGPTDAAQFLDRSSETMSSMEFLDNVCMSDSSSDGEQLEQALQRPHSEAWPRRIVQLDCC
eukprot:5320675-Pyramimonas_sp.AAC.1